MYKQKSRLGSIFSNIVIYDNRIFFTEYISRNIECWDYEGKIKLWKAERNGLVCQLFENQIFSSNLLFYNISGELIFENIGSIVYSFVRQYKNLSIWHYKNEHKDTVFAIFDMKAKEFLYRDFSLETGPRYLNDSAVIYETHESGVACFDFTKSTIRWQHDFAEECRYIDSWNDKEMQGKLEYVIQYEDDKVIITYVDSKTFCIEVATGNILWENTFTGGLPLLVVGDTGYANSNGGSIHKIDLKTGKSLHADQRFHSLPSMPYYKDIHISTNLSSLHYHDGLLWGLIYSNGLSFVVAINPFDYEYEWIHHVEVIGKVDKIEFYENKMYLSTTEMELVIYEKEPVE